jgi:hypothetical protein
MKYNSPDFWPMHRLIRFLWAINVLKFKEYEAVVLTTFKE